MELIEQIEVVFYQNHIIKYLVFYFFHHFFYSMFQMLLFDFTHHNIEMACVLLETCGLFLYRSKESHNKTRVFLVSTQIILVID